MTPHATSTLYMNLKTSSCAGTFYTPGVPVYVNRYTAAEFEPDQLALPVKNKGEYSYIQIQ